MRSSKKILVSLIALCAAFSLTACGSGSSDEADSSSSGSSDEVLEFNFEIEEGPAVTITMDTSGGYYMYAAAETASGDEDDEEEETADIDFGDADFVITGGDDMIYVSFKTVSETTEAELFYYPDFEEIQVNGLEGFYVQGGEEEYDLLLELNDERMFICFYAYDADIDLTAAAQSIAITVSDGTEDTDSDAAAEEES